jgi:outer membrane autotransporter protein
VNQEKAQPYLYGAAARMAALNDAIDHGLALIDHWHLRQNAAPHDGPFGFASLQGASIKTKTGSSVNSDGVSLIVGTALETPTADSHLTAAVFAEGGLGNYDSRSAFADGDGDTRHYGLGAFGKFRFDTGVYLDGSVRAGRAKADYADPGKRSYESETPYGAMHLGMGIETALTPASILDTYAKILGMKQKRDTVSTRAGEKLSFDAATSLRSRLGARYVYTAPGGFKAWGGLAWEREFDGEVKARLDDTRIDHRTKPRGNTGLAEIGVEYDTARWRVTGGVQGLWGKRHGVAGMLSVSYRF